MLTQALTSGIISNSKRCADDTKQQHSRVDELCELGMLGLITMSYDYLLSSFEPQRRVDDSAGCDALSSHA